MDLVDLDPLSTLTLRCVTLCRQSILGGAQLLGLARSLASEKLSFENGLLQELREQIMRDLPHGAHCGALHPKC